MEAKLEALKAAGDTEARTAAAKELASSLDVNELGEAGKAVVELLKGSPDNREQGALLESALLGKHGAAVAPYFLETVPMLLKFSGDKKNTAARDACDVAGKKFGKKVPAFMMTLVFDEILKTAHDSPKWQTKVLALNMITNMVENCPDQISDRMTVIVPAVSGLFWDSKPKVQKAANKCLKACCGAISNDDLKPFIPELISAINKPEEVTECVHKLAATTFVQTVDASALAITVPVLDRGFKERGKTATIRKCAVITENMAKLVEDSAHVAPFMPVLEPHLAKAKEQIADPECRSRCAAAHEALLAIAARATDKKTELPGLDKLKADVGQVMEKIGASKNEKLFEIFAKTIQEMLLRQADERDWKDEFGPVLRTVMQKGTDQDKAEDAALQFKAKTSEGFEVESGEVIEDDVADDDHEKLCDCRFSLAYGSRILLNNARLYLKRGMRYGIVAAKSAGKTTLLRSISNGQLEGFPSPDELKTVFVEHDIQASQARMNVTDFTLDTCGAEGVTREQVVEQLDSIGFTDEMKNMPIMSLSGGWKMKLALARAMLRKADILLLDEPTNHLDVVNVQWVVDYLTGESCKHVTSLIVSHDTKFLDKVATHVIHFDTLKLNTYLGNLSKFVERFPEAKSYYDLSASTIKFQFPKPAPIDGVKARGKAILSMTDVSFTYPGAPKPQLNNVTIKVSMASRVACVGANGAGKSTMIKLLTGELKPSSGVVYKHPNCVFAYVAQHAFHHIENHLEKTPVEYVLWRFSGGEDKESLNKVTVKLTEEEEKKMAEPIICIVETEDGKKVKEKRNFERLMARRRNGKIYEYEVKFKGKTQGDNIWYSRDDLLDMGFKKVVEDLDRRKAAQEGAYNRVLTRANVEQHFLQVGLETELASHNRISSLSGGQKVKVVLGACTWNQPHLIILDEPTNYLDREALGALSGAINDFEGGVLIISHNQEFCESCTRETWVVANHQLTINGDAEWQNYAAEALELQAAEEQVDAMGNKVEVKRTPASLNKKDKKKMMKDLKEKLKDPDMPLTEFEEMCAHEWGLFE